MRDVLPLDPAATVARLLHQGERLTPRVRDAILALDRDAVAPLIAILNDDDLADEDAPGEGYAPIHAATLLGELRAPELIAPALRILAEGDWETILSNAVAVALPKVGAPALEPLLDAYPKAHETLRETLLPILGDLGVRDERVYELLIAELVHHTELAAIALADYGDARAVPALTEATRAAFHQPDDGFPGHTLIELRAAIEKLGGVLPEPLRARVDAAIERAMIERRKFADAFSAPATSAADASKRGKIGRNEPCPCGSGKKYKKCCGGPNASS